MHSRQAYFHIQLRATLGLILKQEGRSNCETKRPDSVGLMFGLKRSSFFFIFFFNLFYFFFQSYTLCDSDKHALHIKAIGYCIWQGLILNQKVRIHWFNIEIQDKHIFHLLTYPLYMWLNQTCHVYLRYWILYLTATWLPISNSINHVIVYVCFIRLYIFPSCLVYRV